MLRACLLIALAILCLGATAVDAKQKAKPQTSGGARITENDLRVCMGVDGSSPEEQVQYCTKVINSGKVKHPYEADYYATRASAYLAMNQADAALADLNKALGIRQAPEFYFERALAHMAKPDLDAAKKDAGQVITLRPDFAPAYLLRGVLAYNSGDAAEALTYFENAIKRVPTYYQAIYARGVAKKKTGDESGGERDIATARGMSKQVDQDLKKLGLKP